MSAVVEESSINLTELASDIVAAYVSNNRISGAELPAVLRSVYETLHALIAPPPAAPEKPVPPIPIKKTVTPDAIISLEDGKPYKSLKRHLSGRGLTPEQYREKWGLPPDYPMVAATYAAQRSELAKSLGLGQLRRERAMQKRAAADAVVSAKTPARRGRPPRTAAE
ncbi:transcriptional regulator, MucR family [Methylobacterium sp. 4-46]|uniref:MucR family transcriptional regulator n=1 Tax=unclassified Methylobacterium TaxID=2615210 RepID=UPI000152CC71|nr:MULTISPECIES: MucR family transcriptional regulator [Methylobacterium]ACA15169.1 transcriptional regulator, MucR family [Methylobacterium sp. 4-46]WFT80903.1 MucR family transcriptional regulator [Methylobacterium nodulans]